MKTKFYKIEDIIIMEIENPEIAFEYYVRDNLHAFEFSENDLKNLYHNGYFDFELERD